MIPFAMMSSKGYFWYLFHCYRWVIYWQVHSLRAIIQALSQVKLFRIKCMTTANKQINLLIDLLYAVHTVCIVLVIAVCVIYVLTHVVLLMSLGPVSFIYMLGFIFCFFLCSVVELEISGRAKGCTYRLGFMHGFKAPIGSTKA